ncbi:carboxypeptidase regulatory-like domain-containing protein [Nannocystis sp. SCPEA4]|uniref:carboxypeptidase regulatory-like domain-containing protein n=1 Tax=Nannocystis sp. SCPEA4 TaxID=2996787 RepID=UPI00226F1D8B|nr:carboxypeptidase regulatory-like domain-containing protein [Nannocystis sp. SCPEA4]MCY1057149.1 carboxypeptidase regulatory-like domain-containing protein [Nannocystis sp. SCPEA4]
MRRERVVVAVLLAIAGGLWWLRGEPEDVGLAVGEETSGPKLPAVGREVSEEPQTIELRLGALASIAGTIVDPKGKPVAGAQVCASTMSERLTQDERRRPHCVTSERDGHYRIAGLFGVRHEVIAGAPTFKPTRYERGEGAGRREWIDLRPAMEALGIDIVLEAGGVEVRGVVKDLSGGAIEGALVQDWRQFSTLTGPEGEFSMWVQPGEIGLQAVAEGYAMGSDVGVAPGHVYELLLTPEAVLVGKVVRAGSGEPLEGVRVLGNGPGGGSTMTDAQGQFRIERLVPGPYKPRAESDEVYGLAEEQVMLGLGETSEPVVIAAHPAFFVEGRVVSEGGGSCDSGRVMLHDAAGGRWAQAQLEMDGVTRFRGIRSGEYTVRVDCHGHVPEDTYEKVKITDRSVSGLAWKVSRGQAIRGVVVDARGKPVAMVRVAASPQQNANDPRVQKTSGGGQTEASGGFEVTGLLPGRYLLEVQAWEPPRATPPKPLEVTLSKRQDLDGVRIELPATGEVRGSVRDAQGRPVRGASVALSGGASRHGSSVSDDGTFRIEYVGVGEYRVRAHRGFEDLRAPGTSDDDVQGEKIEVRSDAVTTVNLVVASASGKITGVVRDEHGGPVADAFVEAARETEREGAAGNRGSLETRWSVGKKPNLTDADGRFSLSDLSEGKHTLRAHRRGGGEAIVEHVALGSEVTLTIAAAGRVTGTVALRGGAAPEEFSVRMFDETSGYRRQDQFYRTGGAWSFAEVPAGTFKLQVSTGAGTAETTVTVATGEELAGVRIELTPKVTVRGTVVDLEGKPVPGMTVQVTGSGATASAQDGKANVTDESGRFQIHNAPAGPVRVIVIPSGRGDYDFTTASALLSAEASTVELPPIRIAPRRVEPNGTFGDLGYTIRDAEPGADPLQRRWIVAHVRAGGPAARAGLVVGDEIVSVDGHDVSGANNHLFFPLTRVAANTAVTLGLARGASVAVTAVPR